MADNAPRFPIYIVSKNRWQPERRLTAKALEALALPYAIVVEEAEAHQYRAAMDARLASVLILDPRYQRDYQICDDRTDLPVGAGAVRNFVWDHARASGAAWHWVMDDNISSFRRLQSYAKIKVANPSVFRCMEDFVLRYTNVAMAGPNYSMFAFTDKPSQVPPFVANTRIYSCNLIRNDVPFRWRGRYNEDTILSLDMLKAGWCTILFNAFLQNKKTTQTIRGGNTDILYANGTLEKSKMLVREHPDVARLVWRYNRWHHYVDYRPFKANRLIKRDDIEIPQGVNNYGMRLVSLTKAAD